MISYGAEADGIVTTARRSADAAASDQVLIAFLKENYQLEPLLAWDTLGMRGTCSAGFTLKAQGDSDQILPVPYRKIHRQTMVPVSHLAWAAVWTGVAAGAVEQHQAGRPRLRQAQAGRRLAGGPQVGHAQPQSGPYRRSQHHRQRPARREPHGHAEALWPGGGEAAGRAHGAHPAALLPHLRPVRRRLPPGPSGGRHVAHPDLRRWLRAVRAGPRAFPGTGPRAHQREVRRLPELHGPVPARAGFSRPRASIRWRSW